MTRAGTTNERKPLFMEMRIDTVRAWAATARGRRTENQDNLAMGAEIPFLPPNLSFFTVEREVGFLGQGALFAVADGCGGEGLGSLASCRALEVVSRLASQTPSATPLAPKELLSQYLEAANEAILLLNRELFLVGQGRRAASTLTLVLIRQDGCFAAANVGDSPLYFIGADGARVLTVEDNAYAEAARMGRFAGPQMRNRLTRCIGMKPREVELYGSGGFCCAAHFCQGKLRPGDRLLLCTDGLHGILSSKQLTHFLSGQNPEQMIRQLTRSGRTGARTDANPAICSSSDNCTVILLDPLWA